MQANPSKLSYRNLPPPLTASYTPSSFLRGFIPSVIMRSATQSPTFAESNSPKKGRSLKIQPSEIEKTLSSMALYRNPIPPDMLTMTKTQSDRLQTIKIFRNKMEEMRGVKMIPTGADRQNALHDQIGQKDSLKTVKGQLEKTLKGYDKRKREKLMGSMYINDLWAQEYEKSVIKAIKVKDELEQQNNHYRRPLKDKFEDLNNFYQKKAKFEKIESDLEDLRAQGPVISQQSFDMQSSEADIGGLKSAKSLNQFIYEKPNERVKSQQSLCRRITNCMNDSIQSLQRARSRGQSLDKIDKEEPALPRKKPRIIIPSIVEEGRESIDDYLEHQQNDSSPKHANTASQMSITKNSSSPTANQANYARNKKKWAELQKKGSFSADKQSPLLVRGMSSLSPKSSGDLFKKYEPLPFALKVEEMGSESPGFMEKSSNTLGSLIGQCYSELDNHGECLGIVKNLKKVYITAKPDKEKKNQEFRKEKTIEEFKYMLKQRKRRTATAQANVLSQFEL